MKYTIEATESGCMETLTFNDKVLGRVKLTRNHTRTDFGSVCREGEFVDQLKPLGYSEEVIEKADECFGLFTTLNFMEFAEEIQQQ